MFVLYVLVAKVWGHTTTDFMDQLRVMWNEGFSLLQHGVTRKTKLAYGTFKYLQHVCVHQSDPKYICPKRKTV